MKANYTIDNQDYTAVGWLGFKAIMVFNYHYANEVVNHFVGYFPTAKHLTPNSKPVGFWKVKKLK